MNRSPLFLIPLLLLNFLLSPVSLWADAWKDYRDLKAEHAQQNQNLMKEYKEGKKTADEVQKEWDRMDREARDAAEKTQKEWKNGKSKKPESKPEAPPKENPPLEPTVPDPLGSALESSFSEVSGLDAEIDPVTEGASTPAPKENPAGQPAVSDNGSAMKASFSDVPGLDTEQVPVDYRTGSEDVVMRKTPGIRKHPNIVMKRSPGDFEKSDVLKNSTSLAPSARDMNQQVASADMRGQNMSERHEH